MPPTKSAAIVLAAGKGSRMKSDLPKVLHQLAGKTLLTRVLVAIEGAGIDEVCLVLGDDLKPFEAFLAEHPQKRVAIQKEKKGTGDAVAAAAPLFGQPLPGYCRAAIHQGPPLESSYVLVCYGDTPCLTPEVLKDFIHQFHTQNARLGLIAMDHPKPFGYGRVVLSESQKFERIVEEKDADDATKSIHLCNTGIVFGEVELLFQLLQGLTANNQQKEYYLTDCFGMAQQEGIDVFVYKSSNHQLFAGVNTKEQLQELERSTTFH